MAEKHLTEAAWKALVKGKDFKDGALLKALAAIEKSAKADATERIKALDLLDVALTALRKDKEVKASKDADAYLADMAEAGLIVMGIHPGHTEARAGWLWKYPHGLATLAGGKEA